MQIGRACRVAHSYPVIDETAAEVGALDPLGDPRVVVVWDEQ